MLSVQLPVQLVVLFLVDREDSHSNASDEIQFVTIASQGNSQDFKNLTVGRNAVCVSGIKQEQC